MNDYVPGMGSFGAKILILGEAPTRADVKSGKPFSDNRELDYLLRDAGINKGDCWLTNVFKHTIPDQVPGKKIPAHVRALNAKVDLDKTLLELRYEVSDIKPNIILGLGSTALWSLTGNKNIQDYRGSILTGLGRKAVCTYNPAHLALGFRGAEFMGYWNRQIILCDLLRVKKQSQFEELTLPHRHLQICRSSYELYEFRERYKDSIKLSVDIEAHGTMLPAMIGLAFNKGHGLAVPLWNADGLSNIPDSDIVNIWRILSEMLWEKDIVGQNFNYDRDKIKRLGFTVRRFVSDTMLKAHGVNPELPKGLAFNTSIYTEEPFYKNDGMYKGKIEDLLTGCARDACVTYEIDEVLNSELEEINQIKFFNNFLMQLPDLYWGIEQQGFKIDFAKRDELLVKYVKWSENLRYELFQLIGDDVNVNSPKQVAIILFDVLKCPRRPGTGEEELTSLLNLQSFTDPMKRRVCEAILEKRRVDKSISTYLMAIPDYDERMRTTYFPCLDTGRSSTGQQDAPIRPELEVIGADGKKKKKPFGIAFQTMTKHGDIGADIRSMYIPDNEDEIFLQADSAQAEARVVFLLADDEQALEDIDTHDYHALTASWFFGGTESDYSKKTLGYESPIRFAGKTLRHAGHLGAGKRRAATELNTQARKYKIPITITEALADKALKVFHARQPKIQRVFHSGIIEALKTRRLIAGLPYGIDAESGGVRTFYERWGDELNRKALSYIPQRSVSDSTKAAAIRIKKRIPNIKIVMEAHDGLLFCIPKIKVVEWGGIIKEEMERPISFHKCSLPRRYLKIPCDIEVGENYESLKKFKGVFQEALKIEIIKKNKFLVDDEVV